MLKEKNNKFLILMAYYNRPKMVINALESILESNNNYKNWHLIFGDDGSVIPGRPIVEKYLKEYLNQITFIESNATFEQKIRDGLTIGRYANQIIKESDADIALMLCDDDALHPMYLNNLNSYYNKNPSVNYAYSKLSLFNPVKNKVNFEDAQLNLVGKFNVCNEPIDPVGKVDASQVSWRLSCCKEMGAWFGESTIHVEGQPWSKDTDRSFFENLYKHCGFCYPTGFVGQYKGIHDYQLLWHKDVPSASLWAYDQMCKRLAGVEF